LGDTIHSKKKQECDLKFKAIHNNKTKLSINPVATGMQFIPRAGYSP
jgi:hypothetical protein